MRFPSLRRVSSQRGQATVETVTMLTFLLFFIFGIIQFTLLAVTKYLVDYAAFVGARAQMVGGNCTQAATTAASTVRWWGNDTLRYISVRCGGTVTVTYRVPFGFPIYPMSTGVPVESTVRTPRAQ